MLNNEMKTMFAGGGEVDPVSGNEVPPGALPEEVRDDVDAKLSEGEFVFPADVVRYLGLQTLMKLRDKAKEGLARMEEIGQMGNADQVENPEALHSGEEMSDDDFSSEIDNILREDEGEKEYAMGGMVDDGTDMIKHVDASGNALYVPYVNSVPQIQVPAGYKRVGR